MKALHDLSRVAPSGEALIRIFECGHIAINAEASRLLALTEDSKVAFLVGDEDGERRSVFIGTRPCSAHRVHGVGKGFRIHSKPLCRQVAGALQGYGAYRVEPESPEKDYSGRTFYRIFFRKYEQQ